MCEASESRARDDIVKGWSTFSEAAKVRCLQTNAQRTPICLESMRDSQKGQEKDKQANPTNKP
jgi:hypothetical protein